jgi:hypothetical protein
MRHLPCIALGVVEDVRPFLGVAEGVLMGVRLLRRGETREKSGVAKYQDCHGEMRLHFFAYFTFNVR